jgi:hypothetical protein
LISDSRVRSLTKDEVLDREIQLGKRNATTTKPYRWVIVLSAGQEVRDVASTSRRLYGPATIRYAMYVDGGIDAVLEEKK